MKKRKLTTREINQIKWRKEHTLTFSIRVNIDNDPEIAEKLKNCKSKNKYIRDLIYKDIKGE